MASSRLQAIERDDVVGGELRAARRWRGLGHEGGRQREEQGTRRPQGEFPEHHGTPPFRWLRPPIEKAAAFRQGAGRPRLPEPRRRRCENDVPQAGLLAPGSSAPGPFPEARPASSADHSPPVGSRRARPRSQWRGPRGNLTRFPLHASRARAGRVRPPEVESFQGTRGRWKRTGRTLPRDRAGATLAVRRYPEFIYSPSLSRPTWPNVARGKRLVSVAQRCAEAAVRVPTAEPALPSPRPPVSLGQSSQLALSDSFKC